MSIELPGFEDTFCRFLTVCAKIADHEADRLPQENLDLTARYSPHAGPALVRLIWDAAKLHFHLDVALRSAFADKAPRSDTKMPQFRKMLTEFSEATAKIYIDGFFIIPVASLPATGGLIFTGNNAIKFKVNKSEAALTGANWRFRAADVDNIRWDLGKDRVVVEVGARRSLSIGSTYLRDALSTLNAAVDRYVLGKKSQ